MIDEQVCGRIEGFLAAEEALAPDAARELALHLAACIECRALADNLDDAPLVSGFPIIDERAYELGPVIGFGGMGRIRVARDLRIGRRVAIKELLYNTDSLAARFVREARVAAHLQHPNIVPVYEVGAWSDGTPFYSMRLIEGRTLSKAISGADSLEERMELLPAVIAAADAVAFAHAKGVVHRDLTPRNILIGEFGESIVIDWGLAKHVRVELPRAAPEYQTGMTQQILTAKGDVIGSPAYMPREQAAGEPIDERADVYALGSILHHLLTGSAPYVGATPKAVLAQVRAAPPPPLDRLAPRAPRALLSIVARAMARDAADRYATGKELVAELHRFQAGLLVAAHTYKPGERLLRWFRR